MDDLSSHLAMAAIIKRSVDIEKAIEVVKGKPDTALQIILNRARERAIKANTALIDADADKPNDIRVLQTEIKLFIDLVTYLAETISEANEVERVARAEMPDEDKAIIHSLIMGTHIADQPESENAAAAES